MHKSVVSLYIYTQIKIHILLKYHTGSGGVIRNSLIMRRIFSFVVLCADSDQKQEGLSSGAIAGIVIAVLLVLAIIIGACMHRRRKISE